MTAAIQTAELDWECVDGIDIPVSRQFGDVYFSKANGLLETRHVFLNGNDLNERLSQLQPFQYFCVGETGFGTGLNILALWQRWQQLRPANQSHLHAISVEKYPLSKADLIRALQAWPELKPLADQLIAQYPLPIAGCHRLNFPQERFSLDLWLGDAHDVFPFMEKTTTVNAWFLDGFAPSCNPELWENNVFQHIVRLSGTGTTFASFSVAGVLKRGLRQYGISISRPRGFGHKREMLKAIWNQPEIDNLSLSPSPPLQEQKNLFRPQYIAVIGAGIAGLNIAWALAQRGHQITLFEQKHALSGASGNPLALLNPKLCPIEKSSEHLMTQSWQYAMRFYPQFEAFREIQVNQFNLKNPQDALVLADQYPAELLQKQTPQQSLLATGLPSLLLKQAGVISPHQLRDQILQHPNIQLKLAHVTSLSEDHASIHVMQEEQCLMSADQVIVCCARQSQHLFEDYPVLRPIRGQISWFNNATHPLDCSQAYSYGGYCMQLDQEHLILGASFHPNRDDEDILPEDHVHNLELIHSVFPDYAQQLPDSTTWQGRASIRAQTADYFPLLGNLQQDSRIFTFAGLGSKGFLFAPLCSEILAALMLNEASPVSSAFLQKLNPQRFSKKVKGKKMERTQNI